VNIKQVDDFEEFKRLVTEKTSGDILEDMFQKATEKHEVLMPSEYPAIIVWREKKGRFSFKPVEETDDIDKMLELIDGKITEMEKDNQRKLNAAKAYKDVLLKHRRSGSGLS
jgi:dsDNA-binding SOS-regulon protein